MSAGTRVVHWYVEEDDPDGTAPVLASLMEDAASVGRDFDCLLIWSFNRLSWKRARYSELRRALHEAGVQLAPVPGLVEYISQDFRGMVEVYSDWSRGLVLMPSSGPCGDGRC